MCWCFRSAVSAILIAVFAATLAAPTAHSGNGGAAPEREHAGACLVAGSDQSVVIGRLGLQEGLGPAAFIVTVPQGVCLSGSDAMDKVERAFSVQLYANTAEGFQDLYRMAGERVYVRGRASGQRTFQQRAPIIFEVIEIATK